MVFFFGNARTAILDVFILFCIRTLGVISWYGGHFRLNLGIIILLTALLPKNIFISQSSSPPKSINLVVYLHWSVITVQGVWVAMLFVSLDGKENWTSCGRGGPYHCELRGTFLQHHYFNGNTLLYVVFVEEQIKHAIN